jgi:hypothetical protein
MSHGEVRVLIAFADQTVLFLSILNFHMHYVVNQFHCGSKMNAYRLAEVSASKNLLVKLINALKVFPNS